MRINIFYQILCNMILSYVNSSIYFYLKGEIYYHEGNNMARTLMTFLVGCWYWTHPRSRLAISQNMPTSRENSHSVVEDPVCPLHLVYVSHFGTRLTDHEVSASIRTRENARSHIPRCRRWGLFGSNSIDRALLISLANSSPATSSSTWPGRNLSEVNSVSSITHVSWHEIK